MHQPVMICPTANARDPRFKHSEFHVTKIFGQCFQQQHTKGLFFEVRSRKKLVRDAQQKRKSSLLSDRPANLTCSFPQRRRAPAMRFDLVFEEPLDAYGVLA